MIERLVNVATPATVEAVSVPPSVPVPEASAAVIDHAVRRDRVAEDIGQPHHRLHREGDAALRRRRGLGLDLDL